MTTNYSDFLALKRIVDQPSGFDPGPLSPKLFPFQADIVRWALRRGRAAIFADCGMGKTPMQLEWAKHICQRTKGDALILAPLAVASQTRTEGIKFDIEVTLCRDGSDVQPGINITNYERLHLFDVSKFTSIVLDESSILKSYDGKTRTEIIKAFSRTPYKLACTATPAPNDFMELGNHAEFLEVMSRGEMLAMFFTHDGGDTSKWRLKGHAQEDFWKWICSWAVKIQKPSDLGYDDDGFILPKLDIQEITVTDNVNNGLFLFPMPAVTLEERRAVRRSSLPARLGAAAQLANSTSEQWLVWCDLNLESTALAKAINGAVEVTGSDEPEEKEKALNGFTNGDIRVLVTKPSIAGFGLNWQQCFKVIFVGLSDSYEQFYQALRRVWRFGQTHEVTAYIITSDLEQAVIRNIQRKEADASRLSKEMTSFMADISSAEIRGSRRDRTHYDPKIPMTIPEWLKSEINL